MPKVDLVLLKNALLLQSAHQHSEVVQVEVDLQVQAQVSVLLLDNEDSCYESHNKL